MLDPAANRGRGFGRARHVSTEPEIGVAVGRVRVAEYLLCDWEVPMRREPDGPAGSGETALRAYRLVLTQLAFRRFWLALLLVMLADEMMRTSLVWYVYAATGSSQAVGLLMVCLTGPILVSGLLAGWLLDRFPRAWVMAADTGFRAALLAAVAGLVAADAGGVPLFYLVAAVQGALLMVLLAGAPAAIAELVAEPSRGAANALESVGFAVAGAAGPFLAGQLIAHGQRSAPLLVSALCYAGFALAVRGMRIGGGERAGRAAEKIPLRASGLLDPAIVVITAMFVVFNVGTGLFAVWLPVVVADRLDGSAATYGSLLSVNGLGLTAGALAAGLVRGAGRLGLAIVVAQVLSGLALLALAFRVPVPLAYVAVLCFGFCSGPMTVWAQTIRMRIVAPQWRGRAFASLRMIMQSGRPIGGAIAGTALAHLSLGVCVVATTAIVAVPALIGALHPALRARDARR